MPRRRILLSLFIFEFRGLNNRFALGSGPAPSLTLPRQVDCRDRCAIIALFLPAHQQLVDVMESGKIRVVPANAFKTNIPTVPPTRPESERSKRLLLTKRQLVETLIEKPLPPVRADLVQSQ